jgi:formiminotetrahydrofolate cyclodeaminase
MAAGLVAKVARASDGYWEESGGVIGQAETFRARVAPLAQADADAYHEALFALRGREELTERYRDQQLRAALERSAEIPIQIAESGCDLACLAALLVENGNPEVRADAAAASILAESGTRVAAKLVETNLGATGDDPRVRHVRSLVAIAVDASERALAAAE